ncbi:HIT family protein [Actinoplanes sichuanensis]|uniref:HIT family protein n=1 Tax=Actinoplanes sichuanensis TaxID=512349 RepID=A0ABW4A3J5_9ACTN|nr:HIT family protein [Actinoplanes sichuanensis]BEL05564.1 HIT family protein [Actinoplanes sichuanensis]
MTSVFTQIITGALPGRFVWQDDQVVAFLTIAPLRAGHTLVVPRQEIDKWTDLPPELLGRVMTVAQAVGRAVEQAFGAPRAALAIAGLEVPHAHVHVSPMWDMSDLDFNRIAVENDQAALDDAAERLRTALRDHGHASYVP